MSSLTASGQMCWVRAWQAEIQMRMLLVKVVNHSPIFQISAEMKSGHAKIMNVGVPSTTWHPTQPHMSWEGNNVNVTMNNFQQHSPHLLTAKWTQEPRGLNWRSVLSPQCLLHVWVQSSESLLPHRHLVNVCSLTYSVVWLSSHY